MQIKFTSILVDDQSRALAFYTEVLGFRKHSDIPMGEYRWLTVVSPDGVEGAEVVLEPMGFPPAQDLAEVAVRRRHPGDRIHLEGHRRRVQAARRPRCQVSRRAEADGTGQGRPFEDSCGNLINLVQPPA